MGVKIELLSLEMPSDGAILQLIHMSHGPILGMKATSGEMTNSWEDCHKLVLSMSRF